MKLTLKGALNISSLKNAQLILDQKEKTLTEIPISNIMIMEGHDVEKWVEPNEMLLTSLIGYQKENEEEFIKLFKQLGKLNCSGLVIKLGRYLTKVPDNLKQLALELNLPLIIIDNDIQYKDIMFQITQLLFNESNRQLEIYRSTNQIFVSLMENTIQIDTLIDKLSKLLGNDVSIVNSIKYQNRQGNYFTTKITNEFVKYVPENKLFSRRYFIHEFTINNETRTEILTQLHTRTDNNKFLCVQINDHNIDEDQYISIDVATNFIDLQLNIETNIKNINKVKINDSIDSLLNENHSQSTDLPNILTDKGFVKEKNIQLIYCEIKNNLDKDNFSIFYNQPNIANNFIMSSKVYWPHLIYRTWPNRLLLMIQTDNDIAQIKQKLNKIVTYTQQDLDGSSKIHISIEFGNYHNLKASSVSCLNTLSLSSSIFSDHKFFITTKDDLGIYQLLINNKDSETIKALIPQGLIRLSKNEPELIETLEQYINHLGNLAQSADTLFIHPKTMSYRINKIEKNYKLNLANANELTNISIGIHLLKIL